jgi:hypothetical protein
MPLRLSWGVKPCCQFRKSQILHLTITAGGHLPASTSCGKLSEIAEHSDGSGDYFFSFHLCSGKPEPKECWCFASELEHGSGTGGGLQGGKSGRSDGLSRDSESSVLASNRLRQNSIKLAMHITVACGVKRDPVEL